MLDDETDLGGGSGAVGPMFPTYDGNGNVTRVYSTNFVQTNQTEQVKVPSSVQMVLPL